MRAVLIVASLLLSVLYFISFSSVLAAPRVGQQRFPGVVHKKFVSAEYIGYGTLPYPETVIFDRQGLMYVSVADGTIRTINVTTGEIKHWAYIVPNLSRSDRAKCGTFPTYNQMCGRPLGIAFDKNEQFLYVADETQGLLRINTRRPTQVQTLATEHEGRVFRITNSLVVGDNNRYVYFTVSNDQYYFEDFMKMTLAARETGRLLRYDLATGQLDTLMDGIQIANGLALAGPEPREYLVLASSSSAKLYRYWIEGPNAGYHDVLVEDLGGYPDNVSPDGSGGFYVSLLGGRSSAIEATAANEEIKGIFLNDMLSAWVPLSWLPFYAHVQHYDTKAKLIEVFKDESGLVVGPMSGAYVHDGFLYAGSFLMPVLTKLGLYNGDTVVVQIAKD